MPILSLRIQMDHFIMGKKTAKIYVIDMETALK